MEINKTVQDKWSLFKTKFLKYGKKYLQVCGICLNGYFLIVILILLIGGCSAANAADYKFFTCVEVICNRTWGGSGPDTIMIKGPDVGWRCAEWDYDENPKTCDGVRPYGGTWSELVVKYDIDGDDDYTKCWCSDRQFVIRREHKVKTQDDKLPQEAEFPDESIHKKL